MMMMTELAFSSDILCIHTYQKLVHMREVLYDAERKRVHVIAENAVLCVTDHV